MNIDILLGCRGVMRERLLMLSPTMILLPVSGETPDIHLSSIMLSMCYLIPSGIFHPDKINVIGNGMVIDRLYSGMRF